MKLCTIKKAWFFLFTILIFNISLSSHAALVARDLDGNLSNGHEGVYDDVLNITWLADANLAASNNFGVSVVPSSGHMNWNTASEWVEAVNAANYLGASEWRMPSATPLNGISFNFITNHDGSSDRGTHLSAPIDYKYNRRGKSSGFLGSELAYHYYNNFLGQGYCINNVSSNGSCDSTNPNSGLANAADPDDNLSLFENEQAVYYWTNVELSYSVPRSVYFNMDNGKQGWRDMTSGGYALLVHSGDIGASVVPLPAAAWLFGSTLLGLIGFKRRL